MIILILLRFMLVEIYRKHLNILVFLNLSFNISDERGKTENVQEKKNV